MPDDPRAPCQLGAQERVLKAATDRALLKLERHKLAIVRELYVEPLLAPEPAEATVGRVVLNRVAHPDEQRASRAQPPCERDLVT